MIRVLEPASAPASRIVRVPTSSGTTIQTLFFVSVDFPRRRSASAWLINIPQIVFEPGKVGDPGKEKSAEVDMVEDEGEPKMVVQGAELEI